MVFVRFLTGGNSFQPGGLDTPDQCSPNSLSHRMGHSICKPESSDVSFLRVEMVLPHTEADPPTCATDPSAPFHAEAFIQQRANHRRAAQGHMGLCCLKPGQVRIQAAPQIPGHPHGDDLCQQGTLCLLRGSVLVQWAGWRTAGPYAAPFSPHGSCVGQACGAPMGRVPLPVLTNAYDQPLQQDCPTSLINTVHWACI